MRRNYQSEDEMTKDEALKLAFEALKDMNCGWKYIRESHGDLYGVGWDRAQQKADDAIAALRQALDHVPDTMKMTEPDMGVDRGAWDDVPDATKWVDELRGGDETEQEPVAWWNPRYGKGEYAFAEEQSPPDDSNDPSDFGWNIPLYTAPPKREWQGLTGDEVNDLKHWLDHRAQWSYIEFARAVEAKLREKNGF